MNYTFKELLDKYELDVRARGYSEKQSSIMRLAVGQFDAFLKSPTDIRLVTGDDYRRFIIYLRGRHARLGSGKESSRLLSGNTVNTYGRNVKTFFAWLRDMDIITDNPLAKIPAPKKTQVVPKIYSEKQLLAVCAAVTGLRDRAIFELFLDSGIRLKELSTIKIGAINVDEGYVTVLGKGNKERVAYFSPLVAGSISAYIQELRRDATKDDYLFVWSTGEPFKSRGIQIMLSRLGETINLEERLAPHKLRHTFATLSKKYGGDIEYLRIIMGHTDIKTTEGYLNVQREDLKGAHTKFSPLTNLKAPRPIPPSTGQLVEGQYNLEPQNRDKPQQHDPSKQIQLGETGKESHSRIRPDMRERYNAHLHKLADLVRQLVNDIEKGNVVPPRDATGSDSKAMFGNLRLPVYDTQSHRLWPFLSKHLDNEYFNPKLTAQLAQITMAGLMANVLKKESSQKVLTHVILEKLIIVSERETLLGKCNICESYFYDDNVQ